MLFRSLALAVAALMLTLPGVAPSQPTEAALQGDLVVHPSAIQASTIAVPLFQPQAGSETLEPGTFSRVIARNLEIAGWFIPVENQDMVNSQDRRDRASEEIDFAEWRALNADYVVRGDYSVTNGQLSVTVAVYDTSIGQRVMAGSTDAAPETQNRDLAHSIADEIVERVTGEEGIARSRILFISQVGRARELCVMDADGGRRRTLTDDGSIVMAACWGANNAEVYFTTMRDYNPDLCGMFIDGSETWYISRQPGLNLSPSWNPTAERIALTLSRDGNSEIYTMNRRGEQLLRLTYQRGIDCSPVWTPNGRQILFSSERTGSPSQIFAMSADGRGQQRLTSRSGYNYNEGATVSPDGRRIAFSGKIDGQFDIFVMDADGDDASWVRLTDHDADDEDPSWTWDGQHIVFSSTRSGSRQIHIMNADGSNVNRLTLSGENLSPVAEPMLGGGR